MAGTKNRLQDYHTAKYARKSDAKITNKVQFPLSVFRSIKNKECSELYSEKLQSSKVISGK